MKTKFMQPLLLLFSVGTVIVSLAGYRPKQAAKCSSQTDTTVYTIVEVAPEFPGGREAMFQFIQSASKYPVSPKNGAMVQIRLLIEKDGSISRVQVAHTDPNANDNLIQEAVRIAKTMPKWTPGSQDGRPLRVLTIFPIRFAGVGK